MIHTIRFLLLAIFVLTSGGALTMRTSAAPGTPVAAQSVMLTVGDGYDYPSITAAVAAAEPGDTIEVHGGTYDAPLLVDKRLTLIGIGNPVIDGHHEGTIVRIEAGDTVFQGFTVQHSGRNFDREDSGISIEAERVQILDNQILDTLFGINAAKSHDIVISGNTVIGQDVEAGLRGDGIKIWYSQRARIDHNHVDRSRDLLVWYSSNVIVSDNLVENGRYGFHFMNSDAGTAERNRLHDNSVGIYIMYGKSFIVRDNLLQGSRGPSGHGLGLKEVDGVDVSGNVVYDNRIGVYIDNSPLSPNLHNTFDHNLIAYNDSGLGVLPSTRNNIFTLNSFVDNLDQVTMLGSGPISDSNQWSLDQVGNFWSDYAGYDANGDGTGDVPYRNQQLSEQLMTSWPTLQLYRYSLAETAVDFAARAMPLFEQDPKFIDAYPLVEPSLPQNGPAPYQASRPLRVQVMSGVLLVLAGVAIFWGRNGQLKGDAARTPGVNRSQQDDRSIG